MKRKYKVRIITLHRVGNTDKVTNLGQQDYKTTTIPEKFNGEIGRDIKGKDVVIFVEYRWHELGRLNVYTKN